jgi:hypothetical protein
LPDKLLNGPVVYGGYGCADSAPIPQPGSVPGYLAMLGAGEEKIIALQRGPTGDPSVTDAACFPGEKAHQAVLAGWDAALFVNRHIVPEPAPFCGSMVPIANAIMAFRVPATRCDHELRQPSQVILHQRDYSGNRPNGLARGGSDRSAFACR